LHENAVGDVQLLSQLALEQTCSASQYGLPFFPILAVQPATQSARLSVGQACAHEDVCAQVTSAGGGAARLHATSDKKISA
jgi:hypothetical protein